MANILSVIVSKYQKTNTRIEQISLIFAIIAVAALFINMNNRNNNTENNTDNSLFDFACPLTEEANLVNLSTTSLKTNRQLSLINFDTEIYETGLTKNEIPVITNPDITNLASLKTCLGDDDELLIVTIDGLSRAYPKRILRFHIAVNDTIGNIPILITYSPLSNYYQVFSRLIDNEVYQFGISGLLYKNTDMLFDTLTETLWSPLNGKALVGNMIGAKLTTLPHTVTSLKNILNSQPTIQSISFKTGFIRDYNQDPFLTYAAEDKQVVGKITYYTDDLNYKTQVIGFNIDEQPYAFPTIEEIGLITKNFEINNEVFTVTFDEKQVINIEDSSGNIIDSQSMYWFVWFDLQPKTKLINLD